MKDYVINEDTLAIIPISKKKTAVYENHDCYVIDETVSKIMDDNCKYNGSSVETRIKSTYSLTGYSYKVPIIVAEDKNLIFFPTCSPRLRNCSWINLSNINKITSKDDKSLIHLPQRQSRPDFEQ